MLKFQRVVTLFADMDKRTGEDKLSERINGDDILVTLTAASTGALLSMRIVWKIDFFSFRQHLTTPMASPAIKCSDLGVSEIDGDWCLVLIPKIMSKRENEDKEREFVSLHLRRETRGGDVPTRFWLRSVATCKSLTLKYQSSFTRCN